MVFVLIELPINMVASRMDLREKVPVNIVKGAGLEDTMNELFNNFEAGEERNAELVNRFFNQTYFKGEESLIDKLIEVNSNTKFNDIEEEGINLALLQYNNRMRDFNDCFKKIANNGIKKAFMDEIFHKVKNEIGAGAPYDHFDTECAVPMVGFNVSGYFQKVVDYLKDKEGAGGSAKKAINILQKINITNKDLNDRLLAIGSGIPLGINLTDPSISRDIRDDFDKLLSFEIGKEANRTIEIANDFSKELGLLTTNTFPAINTIVGESDEYRYDERKLGAEYQSRLQVINDDTNLSEYEKKKQIKDLKREYYIRYLKTKNLKIGNALEQLYNNDFDYSKIDRTVLKGYLDTVADIRFKKLFEKGINEYIKLNFGNIDEFKKFYMDIADVDPANPTLDITLSDVNIPGTTPPATGNRILRIQRKLVEGENEWLKDLDEFGKNAEKSFDALPIEYTINKSDIDALDITIEDKAKLMNFLAEFDQGDKYEIKGEKVGILIYLYFVMNSRTPITQIDYAKQKEVESVFGKAKNTKKETKENKDYTPEKFKKDIETYGSEVKFENGSEIWLPMGSSELPGGGYQWMKVKISNIDMTKGTFEGKIFGGELKFGNNMEGKSRKFDMNEKFFTDLKKISKESNKIWLMPNPEISDFNTFKNRLNGKLGTSDFSFPPSGITRTGNKFVQKITDEDGKEKEVKVKYFGARDDDKTSYKIEYNQIKKSFTVSSAFNGTKKGKNGKNEKKRFSYKRDMDWNNFLIFFTQKGLQPQTEEEAKSVAQKQEQEFKMVNGGHRKLNWFSINNIRHGFKDIIGAIKKKMDDYNKKQDENFRGIIEEPILNALSKLPLGNAMKYAIGERQQEIYNEAFNGAWKEIEGYLKVLQSDGQFADTFDQVPPHVQTIYGKSYQKFIKDLFEKKGNTTTTEKRKAAALLLANYEKGGSPFRGLSEYENKGLRVKIILGEAHYQQFLRDKAECIRDRDLAESSKDSGLDKKGLNEQLATCEMDYIINNVRGAYPKLPGSYFPSHEKRGINGDSSTNYIPNPSKRLLSEQFANKLEDAKKGWFTKSSVEDTYNKNKSVNRFEIMEDDFGKAGSSRYKQAAGALRRMIDLASDEPLKNRMKKHFLTYLLSGILDVNCDPGLKKQIYGWAKPMMFVPGLLVKEAGVAENVAILLDNATDNDFSKHVKKYFHRKDQLNGQIDFKGLQEEINAWLTDETIAKLEKYFSDLPTKDFSNEPEPQRSVLEKYKKAMSDSNRDEADWGILDNAKAVSNGLLSSVEVVQKRLNIKNGAFNGKDIDENNNMEDFWKNVTKDINSRSTEPRQVAFVLDKFLNWFGIDNQQVYERILTADHYRKHPGYCIVPYKGVELNMGNIGRKEIDSILWYAFQGNAWRSRGLGCDKLPPELFETLESFRVYFSKAFYNGKLLDSYVVNKGFQPKFKDAKTLLMGSRTVYDQSFTGDSELSLVDTSEDDLFSSDDNKKRKAEKNKKKELLKSSVFINSDIANIDKQLIRNLGGTSGQFTPITSSISRTLRDEYLDRLAA